MKAFLAGFALTLISGLASAQVPTTIPTAPKMPAMPAAALTGNAATAPTDATSLAKTASDKAMVHLNTASVEDLQKLPGIGPEKAKAIVAARPFKSVDDLKKVKGIKEGVFAKVKGMVAL